MFCGHCGKEIPDDAQFCTSCGISTSSTGSVLNDATLANGSSQEVSDPTYTTQFQANPSFSQQSTQYTNQYADQYGNQYAGSYSNAGAQFAQPQFAVAQAIPQGAYAQAVPFDKSKRTKQMIIGGAACFVLAVIVTIVCLFGFSRKSIAIDNTNFPNDAIREAVTVGLDVDGDGVLSPEEADQVTGIVATPTGVEFVTNYNNVDFVVNFQESWQSNPYPGTGHSSGTSNASSSDSSGVSDNDISKIFVAFPKMKSLILRDRGLTELDLSTLTDLEYLDCTGNAISTIDLSKNDKLVSLFCDENVALTGLDSAGLYYRDLITNVSTTRSGNTRNAKFGFDYMGRVTTAGGKKLTYDDDGRLIRAQGSLEGDSDWYEEYKYNEDGLLAAATTFYPLDVDAKPFEYVFEYDKDKNLSAFSEEGYGRVVVSGAFEYNDGKLSSLKMLGNEDKTLTVERGSDGRISEILSSRSSNGNTIGTYAYKYLSDGQCSQMTLTPGLAAEDGYVKSFNYSTVFSNNDAPQRTDFQQSYGVTSNYSFNVTYETNLDGYITKVVTPPNDGETILSGSTMTISYVKHVGKLEDLPSQRYVPVYHVANTERPVYALAKHPNQDLHATTGTEANISILEDGPMQAAIQTIGLAPNLTSNPNEQKLMDYLAEHWADPMVVTSGTAASSKSVQQAAQSNVNDSARVVDTEYFTFTMPESWVGKVEMTSDHDTAQGPSHEGGPQVQELHWYFFTLKGSQVRGDVLTILVTNDPTGEFGECAVAGEFKVNDALTGYLTFANNGFYIEHYDKSAASQILNLQSGGAITSPGDQMSDNKIIETWLKQNVLANIKVK